MDPKSIVKHLRTCHTEYGKFIVLNNDFIGKWMLRGKHFEIQCIRPLLEQLEEGDIVLDIGANIGCYTIPFAQAVGTKGKVYSFEPQGIIKDILAQNIIENKLENSVQVFHSAVGHLDGTATMNARCDRGREINYDREEETNYGGVNLGKGGEQIEMVSLDNFVVKNLEKDKKVKLIKIDVEGAEKMVIYGAKKMIEEHRPVVFYEDNYKKITREMVEMFNLSNKIINFNIKQFFKDLNYSEIRQIGQNYLCIP